MRARTTMDVPKLDFTVVTPTSDEILMYGPSSPHWDMENANRYYAWMSQFRGHFEEYYLARPLSAKLWAKQTKSFKDLMQASFVHERDLNTNQRDSSLTPEGHALYRHTYCTNYSWAYRPEPDGWEKITRFIVQGNGPALELGAGTGLWAELYKRYTNENCPTAPRWICTEMDPQDTFTDVIKLQADEAVTAFSEAKTLVLSWPEYAGMELHDRYAAKALRKFQGPQLIYVGDYDHVTSNEEFLNLLAEEWEQQDSVDSKSWIQVDDKIGLYVRKDTSC